MDLAASCILCSQLLLYKNNEAPFNQPYNDGFDDPISWWTSMEIEPPYLQNLALRLFSICPNSASCERGFSMCGWITNKRRVRLGVERLESITKLISYYQSNAHSEFGFYGKGTKKGLAKLNNTEINAIVNDALAEPDEDDDDENIEESQEQITTDGFVIPDNQVIVLIENTIDILHPNILSSLGEFPDDNLDDELNDDDENSNNNDDEINEDEIEEETRRGVMDFSVEDLSKEFIDE
jgi:hypothetical protein